MFGLFKKKQPNLPSMLYFKSNQAAFEYACKFCITTLENEQPVIGIVLGSKGQNFCIKLSNDDDSSVPSESPEVLLDHKRIKNICFSAVPIDAVPALATGDLVLYVAPAALAAMGKGGMAGLIVAKVQPALETESGKWLLA